MNEVYVFGVPKDKFVLHRNVKIRYQTVYPPPKHQPYKISDHMVEIYNEETGKWEQYPCNETVMECPVCGKLMKVYYIPGTTWFATCSEECNKKLREKARELGGIMEALKYFSTVV